MNIASKKNHIRETRQDRIFFFVNKLLLVLFLLVLIVPIINIISCSFSSPQEVILGHVFLLPKKFTLAGYEGIAKNPSIVTGFLNSMLYLVVEMCIGVVLTIMAAYPLSIPDLPGNKFITMLFTFTMMFSGGMIPAYINIRNLHMLDTIWAITLPSALTVYHIILMKSYFRNNIPHEIYEAAEIDGCDVFQYLIRFILPLSLPIIAVIALYKAVGSWNGWVSAMIYLKDQAKFPLQLILRDILVMNRPNLDMMDPNEIQKAQEMADLLKYSLIVVSSLPMILVYSCIQKYFVKGMTLGAVKG